MEKEFEYKDIPDDKKVKLMALKQRKYAFIWWNNVFTKMARKGKGKIRTWRKIKEKLNGKFLLPITFKTITPTSIMIDKRHVEEYTREFKRLVMNCDPRENENQLWCIT